MASGCCGKNCTVARSDTGTNRQNPDGAGQRGSIIKGNNSNDPPKLPRTIVNTEMVFFCFDVLLCQLQNLEPPKTPLFTNQSW